VGMLPPKLAQTIVNLATGPTPPTEDTIILDPFCGTGVILQESLLMGYGAYGTDLEPRMIDYTRENLAWLSDYVQHRPHSDRREPPASEGDSTEAEPGKVLGDLRLQGSSTARERSHSSTEGGSQTIEPESPFLEVGDATKHRWTHPFTTVASETYLGHPLSNWPTPEKLQKIIGTCNVITEHFLRNIGDQMPAGTRLCLAVPAWRNPNGRIHHLPVLDRLHDLRYNRVSFSGVSDEDLVYYRPDQFVARELLVIIRK